MQTENGAKMESERARKEKGNERSIKKNKKQIETNIRERETPRIKHKGQNDWKSVRSRAFDFSLSWRLDTQTSDLPTPTDVDALGGTAAWCQGWVSSEETRLLLVRQWIESSSKGFPSSFVCWQESKHRWANTWLTVHEALGLDKARKKQGSGIVSWGKQAGNIFNKKLMPVCGICSTFVIYYSKRRWLLPN